MFQKILVPLDGSKLAEAVLPYVVDVATSCHAQIVLVHAIPPASQMIGLAGSTDLGPMVTTNAEAISATLEAETKKMQAYMEEVAQGIRGRGLDVAWVTREGPAGATIVDVAGEMNIGLVALSTHGRSGLGRLIFGSVADHVLRRSGLPILLIKPDEKGEGER